MRITLLLFLASICSLWGVEEPSVLFEKPDWSELDAYQNKVSRSDFIYLLEDVFAPSNSWRRTLRFEEDAVYIKKGVGEGVYRLAFRSQSDEFAALSRGLSSSESTAAKPLKGIRIALDPGHIGGAWAEVENKSFVIGDNPPMNEGDHVLAVSKLAKKQLEAWGAEVLLVRKDAEPVTPDRPRDFKAFASAVKPTEKSADNYAKLLFYRISEIRSRAKIVNEFEPDLVLCLHMNAGEWPNGERTFVDKRDFHVLVNGCYSISELAKEDHRFAMVLRIVQGVHDREVYFADQIAEEMAKLNKLPPFEYKGSNAKKTGHSPYVWARNLLANRVYRSPTVFLEPYGMNSYEDYVRLLEGDEIIQEYADGLVNGILKCVE